MSGVSIQDWQVWQPENGGWPLHVREKDGAPACGTDTGKLRLVSWRTDRAGIWCGDCFRAIAGVSPGENA